MDNTRSLQEVLFAAHFEAPLPLSVLDLADWRKTFERQFPLFQQQPAWDPYVWLDFHNNAIQHPHMPQISMLRSLLPRVMAFSEDQRWSIHFQGDRVAISWRRTEPTGEPTPYPGFWKVAGEALAFLESFREWWQTRFDIPVNFRVCELNYFNAFPLAAGHKTRLSDVFKFIVPQPSKMIANLNVNWTFPSDPPDESRVHFVGGMGVMPDCPAVAVFNFAGANKTESGGTAEELKTTYEKLHDIISDAYITTINTKITGGPI